MSKIISFYMLLCISFISKAQTTSEKPLILYGAIAREELTLPPFETWFTSGRTKYVPNAETVAQLKKQNMENISIRVFFGTWCGDSKREVPHFLKLMDELSFPDARLSLIATGGGDSLYKQSPHHEESGLGIYRVPTIIFYYNGVEINRITENPVLSLEKDMLRILSGQKYVSGFRSYEMINGWLKDGTLQDENISTAGLATQLRPLVNSESELNSLAYILLDQDKKKEAITVFRINYSLYPQSANVITSLGEGYLKTGDTKNSILYMERSLTMNKDPQAIKGILDILYKAKGFDQVGVK